MSNLTVKDTQARKRLASLFDDGVFTEIDAFAKSANGDAEAVAGFGSVNGTCVYAFSQDVTADSGAISVAQCAKLKKVYDMAMKTGCPIVGIYDSNGLKLTEGFEALNSYGEILKASSSVSGVVPQISIIAGACLGTTALMANMADVVVAVEDADFYVTAPSEVTAAESAKAGTVDVLAKDFDEAVVKTGELISLLPSNNLDAVPVFDFTAPDAYADENSDAMAVINAVADAGSVFEIKKDYAENAVTALASVLGLTVGFVSYDGNNLCPNCAYKAEAFIKLCDAYNIPIVTFVNANGLAKGKENQMLIAATKLTAALASATCPKISVVTGSAVGAAYIALAGRGANADVVYAWDTAVLSPLEVESAVAFLYNDRLAKGESREALAVEYKESLASAFTAGACGAVDDIFVPAETRAKVIAALDMLAGKRETTLPRKHSVK